MGSVEAKLCNHVEGAGTVATSYRKYITYVRKKCVHITYENRYVVQILLGGCHMPVSVVPSVGLSSSQVRRDLSSLYCFSRR